MDKTIAAIFEKEAVESWNNILAARDSCCFTCCVDISGLLIGQSAKFVTQSSMNLLGEHRTRNNRRS